MTFIETLHKAQDMGINCLDLEIANELDCQLQEEISEDVFNNACDLVRETYLKYEELPVFIVVKALRRLAGEDMKDLNKVTRKDLGEMSCILM